MKMGLLVLGVFVVSFGIQPLEIISFSWRRDPNNRQFFSAVAVIMQIAVLVAAFFLGRIYND